MALSIPLLLLTILCSLCSFIKLTTSSNNGDDFSSGTICMGNSTKGNSLYQSYDNSVSSLLPKFSIEYLSPFANYSSINAGKVPNKAYGSYICWGHIDSELCHECVVNVSQALSNQDFYEECFGFGYVGDNAHLCLVHYANHSTSSYERGFVLSMGSLGGKVPNIQQYNRTLLATFQGLIKEAAVGNWTTTNFATRVADVPGSNQKIYILVQCTPAISAKNCSSCLMELYSFLPSCCTGNQGGLAVHANCMMKYNNQSLFGGAHNSSYPPRYVHVCLVLLLSIYFLMGI